MKKFLVGLLLCMFATPAMAQITAPKYYDADAKVQKSIAVVCVFTAGTACPSDAGGQYVVVAPSAASAVGITAVVSPAAESGRVLKASAGNLYSISVTSGASAGFLMVFNSTTVPADGAVTPIVCRAVGVGATVVATFSDVPAAYSTGISAAFSTTGCFTKTASATAFFEGYVK